MLEFRFQLELDFELRFEFSQKVLKGLQMISSLLPLKFNSDQDIFKGLSVRGALIRCALETRIDERCFFALETTESFATRRFARS